MEERKRGFVYQNNFKFYVSKWPLLIKANFLSNLLAFNMGLMFYWDSIWDNIEEVCVWDCKAVMLEYVDLKSLLDFISRINIIEDTIHIITIPIDSTNACKYIDLFIVQKSI